MSAASLLGDNGWWNTGEAEAAADDAPADVFFLGVPTAAAALDRKDDEDEAGDGGPLAVDWWSGDFLMGVPPTRNGLDAGDRLTGDRNAVGARSAANRPALDGVSDGGPFTALAGAGGGELERPDVEREVLAAAGAFLAGSPARDELGAGGGALRDLL